MASNPKSYLIVSRYLFIDSILIITQGSTRGRKKKADKDVEKEKIDEEREKPYACEGRYWHYIVTLSLLQDTQFIQSYFVHNIFSSLFMVLLKQ